VSRTFTALSRGAWHESPGASAFSGQQVHAVAHGQSAALDHIAVQTEPAPQLPDDPAEHRQVLLEGVRVVRRHDTAAATRLHTDHRLPNPEPSAGPGSLGEALDPFDQDVRSKPTAIHPQVTDHPVRGDQ
jgi:hypothetical protein